MTSLFELSSQILYRHSGSHIAHSDLQELLRIPEWKITAGQHWGIVGGKEEQRSALLNMLREENKRLPKSLTLAEISLTEQQRRIDNELLKSRTGVADEIFSGTPVYEILAATSNQTPVRRGKVDATTQNARNPGQLLTHLVDTLAFDSCMRKHFRELSSGETRRLLIVIALLRRPDVLLLHDPLEGLDNQTRPVAAKLLDDVLHTNSTDNNTNDKAEPAGSDNSPRESNPEQRAMGPLPAINSSIFAASRPEQLPAHTTHIAHIDGLTLHLVALQESRSLPSVLADIQASAAMAPSITVPSLPKDHPFHQHKLLKPGQPLVDMRNVTVSYTGEVEPVLNQLNWTVRQGQHWRITGVNGSGKTTLLKLVTGDHPQVYKNAIEVCGFQRGNGESIWEVKRHIGYMGGEILWSYRNSGQLAGKTLKVVMSGLYDSIGLYTQPNAADKKTALQWLELFEMAASSNQRFQSLGLAEQRLALIARAMIKRPSLLILDEPLQGLDVEDRKRVLTVVEKLIATNATTLLYVSHHDDEQVQGVQHLLEL